MNKQKTYSFDEAKEASLKYFRGDGIAADAYLSKYALKQNGDPNQILEPTPHEMHKRLASEFARIERKFKNGLSEADLFSLMDGFKYIIPQGGSMMGIGNPLPISLSNCFVIGNRDDSYGSICMTDEEQVQLSKRRGGVGHDMSYIRPKGAHVNNAAVSSSGMVSFMERYSHSIREVAQNGRRGALMLSCSIKHPQAEDFIDAKMEEGKIVGANISVKITDDFMEAVRNNNSFIQQFPIDSEEPFIKKEISASKLWKKLMHNAWKSAEPGILFWDTILNESTARLYGKQYEEMSTNPCFTGDTKIAYVYKTLDDVKENKHQVVTIKELAESWDEFYTCGSTVRDDNTWISDYANLAFNKEFIRKARAFKTGTKNVIKVTFENGQTIRCTPDHLLALEEGGKYIKASESLGKNIFHNGTGFTFNTKNNETAFRLKEFAGSVTVISIEPDGVEDVYDLNVDDVHNFHVLAEGNNYKTHILVHNCGEIPMSSYSSCILIAMNLYSYVKNPFTSDAHFDFELFKHHAHIAQRMADDIIELECEKIQQIINKINTDPENDDIKRTELNLWFKILTNHQNTRRTGLGITALGDMLAALGMKYGTPEATSFAGLVQHTLAVEAYSSSVQLAKERGSFPIWDWEKERYSPFLNRIINDMTPETYRDYMRYGRRNIHCLTIAPTGTVSLMTQTTSGIECVFMPVYVRRRKVEEGQKFDFQDEVGDRFVEYTVCHHKLVEWYRITHNPDKTYEWCQEHLQSLPVKEVMELVEQSPYHGATTRDVDWVEKVRMQGAMQQYVDHSISVTVNLPKEATEELVSKVYMTAWESGCKGCTIYRDGSRSGVLVAKEDKKEQKTNLLPSGTLSKRKPVLNALVDVVKSRGETFAIIIGIDDNMPYEVFAFKLKKEEIPLFKKNKQTTVTKIRKKVYSLGSEFTGVEGADNILTRFGSEEEQAITRMVSTMLRGGRIPLVEIIDQIIKSSTSIEKFSKVLAVCLQKFLKDDIILHEKCPNCGGDMISYEGCKKCVKCGQSKCG